MKAKLKVIKNWEFEEFELTGTSFNTGWRRVAAGYEREFISPTI